MTLTRSILRCAIWLLVGPVAFLLACLLFGYLIWSFRAGLPPGVLKILALHQKVSLLSLGGFWALVLGLLGVACLIGTLKKIKSAQALIPLAIAGVFLLVSLKFATPLERHLANALGQKMARVVTTLLPLFGLTWPLFFLIKPYTGEKESFIVRRGTKLLTGSPEMIQRKLKSLASKKDEGPPGILIWNGCPLPRRRENEHILLAGSGGSGKTQIIYRILQEVRRRGEGQVLVFDYKSDFAEAICGEDGVALLAPWDARSLRWSLGQDITSPLDCHSAARILIPGSPRESQPYFPNTARDVLQATMIRLDTEGENWSFENLWQKLSGGKDRLAAYIQQTNLGRGASEHLKSDPKSSSSIYSTLLSQTSELMWLARAWPDGNFSVRKWVKETSAVKTLIISGKPKYEEIARANRDLALHIAVNEILSLPDDLNRKIWLFLDELPRLGAMDVLLKAFATGRSKGLCVVAGIQDIGQIQEIYGRDLAQTISNTFNTKIILRSTDPQTATWGSDVIGQQEVEETFRTKTVSPQGGMKSDHTSQATHPQVRTQSAVLASTIQTLDSMKGFLCVPGWDIPLLDWSPKTPLPKNYPTEVTAEWVRRKAELAKTSGESMETEVKESGGPEEKGKSWNLE